jgi:hypothetical protein
MFLTIVATKPIGLPNFTIGGRILRVLVTGLYTMRNSPLPYSIWAKRREKLHAIVRVCIKNSNPN